ncbi:MAG TPA: prepilin-type N-terminal cleavage/methylation domain-containing protein [Candidatus Didemnitutus sp.]|nr:prepilin-type N-terminal cleavage/methylation domain-containing protein [Candidatus Didemnitutus sp.]
MRTGPGPLADSRDGRAFTLVEIMLVLALMALVATVTLTGTRALSDASAEGDAESAVQNAISGARRSAVAAAHPIALKVTDNSLVWEGGSLGLPPGDTKVFFLPAQRDALILVGGEALEDPIKQVMFYPDGTCDAFRVEFKRKQGGKIVAFDPWTAAPLADDTGGHP